MHPHGVRYTPDYDGVYLGDHTRVGGFIAPGEEFTYTWEATPDSVGVWPYHDHGPNHTLNTFRGAFGAIVIRERGAKVPDIEQVLFLHQLLPPVTRLPRAFQAINGRTARRQHADDPGARRPGRRDPRDRDGQQLPRLPHPRTPLEGRRRRVRGHPARGAERDDHGALRRGQSGPLAVPLPRLLASGRGMAGWYMASP